MPCKVRRNTPAVFLGNLRTDVRISILKDSIIALFALINIDHVRKRHISVICRPHATFSFVSVPTKEDADNAALKIIGLLSHNSIADHFLDRLVEQGLYLKVDTSANFTGSIFKLLLFLSLNIKLKQFDVVIVLHHIRSDNGHIEQGS